MRHFGSLTTLVNAAGIIGSGTIETTTDEQWDVMLDINSRAPFRLMRAAVPALVASRGSIVNVSSISALRPRGLTAYSVSKGAVIALTVVSAVGYWLCTIALKRECQRHGIHLALLFPTSGMDV